MYSGRGQKDQEFKVLLSYSETLSKTSATTIKQSYPNKNS